MTSKASQRQISSPVATTATRIPPVRAGGLIIFDYEDPSGRWLNPNTSPFSNTELHTFRAVHPSQRLALATESARAASSRIRAGATALFATSRDQVASADEPDPLGGLVSTAIMGVADTPAYTLIVAPGRWRQYLDPFGIATDIDIPAIAHTADLWQPETGSGVHGSAPIVWRGASETETIANVKDLLAGGLASQIAV